MCNLRIFLLFSMVVITSSLDAQTDERFSRFTFEGATGTAPNGWTRDFDGHGGLRMAPRDATGFFLEAAMTKVPPRWKGDVTPPLVFLHDLNLFEGEHPAFRELPGDRAVAVSDYTVKTGRGYVRHRGYYVVLRAKADTMYVVVATASEPVPTPNAPFTTAHIRDAENAILGIIVDK